MMLGQPETPAERAEDLRRMLARQRAREHRNAEALRVFANRVAAGEDPARASRIVAQRFKLGRGGAGWLRERAEGDR